MKFITSIFICSYGLVSSYPCAAALNGGGSSGLSCEAPRSCWYKPNVVSVPTYLYNSTTRSCVLVDSSCVSNNATVFTDLSTCKTVCMPNVDTTTAECEQSTFGCCPDKVTSRGSSGLCAEDKQPSTTDRRGSFSHWQLLVAGICSVLVGVSIVSLVFGVAYLDKRRKKDKQKRYINQVLKMYEDSVDSVSGDSDSSFDDNPETRNLFERL